MKTLIVIDVQNDFITGSLANPEAEKIIPNIKNKIEEYRQKGIPIIFTKDSHCDEVYDKTIEGKFLPIHHCIVGTWGHDIVDGLSLPTDEIIFKSNFGTIDWDMFDFEDVEIIGVCTDICVISNAIIIKTMIEEFGHTVTVDSSCCAGTTIENHQKALDIMRGLNINIK